MFVGDGALLKDALTCSIKKGHPVEYVFCSNDELSLFLEENGIQYKITRDINSESEWIQRQSTDRIIISVNNGQLFKKNILSIDNIRIYNIHNGLVPGYRGMPEICILFALLRGEPEYGVSLHKVDEGIDTGPCYAIMKFDIDKNATFQQVMHTSLHYCSLIYQMNIDRIISGELIELPPPTEGSRLYGYRDLENLYDFIDNRNFSRATKLGVFRLWFEELAGAINVCKERKLRNTIK